MENAKLITDIKPELIVNYNKLRVGFYDKVLDKGEKGQVPTLYIYIENAGDGKTINRRAAGNRKVRNHYGDLTLVPETQAYARAYNKYLEYKNNLGPSAEELKIKELESKLEAKEQEAKLEKAEEEKAEEVEEVAPVISLGKEEVEAEKEEAPVEEVKEEKKLSEKTVKELKADLDAKGIKYVASATKESLLELLHNA